MKKLFSITIICLLAISAPSFGQSTVDKAAHGVKKGTTKAWEGTKKGTTKAWEGTKKGATKAWNGTKKGTSKAKAAVTDKKSETWIGPDGQTIYTTGDNRYYWVNGNGKRIYVSESALKARNK